MKRLLYSLIFFILPLALYAQIDTKNVLLIGRNALYYKDYVLSIQYFNQVIEAKPYMWDGYYYRGLAKYYLEDYGGAIADCSSAITRNPFIPSAYNLRGISRVQTKDYKGAIEDYTKVIEFAPEDNNAWYNRVLCHLELKEYDKALFDIDSMLTRWPNSDKVHFIKAQLLINQKDTIKAEQQLERALAINSNNTSAWALRGLLALQRNEYEAAISHYNKAIIPATKDERLYINRALAHYKTNKLRQAMSDYDMALSLHPNSYLAHYNRGLLRMQVGDDNRAIEDFNFVLKANPDNMLALFNRALLHEQTGNYKEAIKDFSAVLKQHPNFMYGYEARARSKRKMGDIKGAQADENKILIANLQRIYGNKQRKSIKKVRKWSDEDIEGYDNIATEDHDTVHYDSEYRGLVQNKKVTTDLLPNFELGINNSSSLMSKHQTYIAGLDALNKLGIIAQRIIMTTDNKVNKDQFAEYHTILDRLDADTLTNRNPDRLLLKAIVLSRLQRLNEAIETLDAVISLSPQSALAHFQRTTLLLRQTGTQGDPDNSTTKNNWGQQPQNINVERVYDNVKHLTNELSAFILYNEAAILAQQQQTEAAIQLYSQAINLQPTLKEAYYNRGLLHLSLNRLDKARTDLSKAGELGVHQAYSVLKHQLK